MQALLDTNPFWKEKEENANNLKTTDS